MVGHFFPFVFLFFLEFVVEILGLRLGFSCFCLLGGGKGSR